MRLLRPTLLVCVFLGLSGGAAQASELRVLSAAAVKPGLDAVVARFERRTGDTVTVAYAPGPEIQQRMTDGEKGFDLVLAPTAVIEALQRGGLVAGRPTVIGQVGIAVAVKHGTPLPPLGDTAAVRAMLLSAKTVILTRGSTGVYLEALITKWGLTDSVAPRLVRVRNGDAVVERLSVGSGAEVGLAAQTELALAKSQGVDLAGPVPADVQLLTRYDVVPLRETKASAAVMSHFLRTLRSGTARTTMRAAGIDPR